MRIIGKIDITKFAGISGDILTDEVVLTDTQVRHIKERHPGALESLGVYIPFALLEPDYVLEANKPNSVILVGSISEDDRFIKVVLRLKTSADPDYFKNSIITLWKIDGQEIKRLLRNKKVLYKRI